MTQSSENGSADQATPGPSSTGRNRQTVLFVILVLGIIALIWEFRIARPNHEQAWDAVEKMLESNYSAAGEVSNTNEDVKQLIGKSPAQTIPKDYHAIEVYKWRRGLPILAYTVQVLYQKKTDGRLLLVNAKLNEEFTDEDLNLAINLEKIVQPESGASTKTVNRDDEVNETAVEKESGGEE